jgi:hypothetical protein
MSIKPQARIDRSDTVHSSGTTNRNCALRGGHLRAVGFRAPRWFSRQLEDDTMDANVGCVHVRSGWAADHLADEASSPRRQQRHNPSSD